jgi:transposase
MEFPHTLQGALVQTTHSFDRKPVLMIGLELSCGCWRTASSEGARLRAAAHRLQAPQPGARLQELLDCAEALKAKWSLGADAQVVVIYEAGQDGFWIARALKAHGWRVIVADPASIPVSRQARRAKTDRLDAQLLLEALMAWLRGERGRLREVRLPGEQAEALRQLVRDRGELQKEIGQHTDRIRKLLRTVGCWQALQGDLGQRLAEGQLRCWDGAGLPEQLQQRLQRECARLALAEQQLKDLEQQLRLQLPEPVRQRIGQLAQLKGVGWVGAMRLVLELFWRDFHNRREVGACLGLVAQPYDSGQSRRDQGISKQGNRRVRALMIEMGWMWLRYQPDSAIARWFAERTAAAGSNKRGKRIAIVAVARRLAIALWRLLAEGVLPQGAQLKRA